MTRTLFSLAAAFLLAGAAQAQPAPGRVPPNPDADNDGKVTLAEFRASTTKRQDHMFARLDTNKDGKIVQAEADAAGKKGEDGGPGRRGGGMLMRLDANKDGAVTKAEMTAMTDRRFQMADSNKDGWLSKDELLTMKPRRGGARAS